MCAITGHEESAGVAQQERNPPGNNEGGSGKTSQHIWVLTMTQEFSRPTGVHGQQTPKRVLQADTNTLGIVASQ